MGLDIGANGFNLFFPKRAYHGEQKSLDWEVEEIELYSKLNKLQNA